ncbi:MAG: hypothetical protein IPI11_00805 [Haliscomenobacter sp.]|nr:hypothetical protein [Haliscomenobacter sp.]
MEPVKRLRQRARLNSQIERLKADRAILLICLGIALALWVPTKMAQVYKSEKKVFLDFRLPPNTTFSRLPPKDMVVVVEGTGWNLLYDFIIAAHVRLTYDLRYSRSFRLSRGQLRTDILNGLFSAKLKIVELNYDGLQFDLEPVLSKKVPVFFAGTLHFEKDYNLKAPLRLTPDSITVFGPDSQIRPLISISTDSLALNNLSQSLTRALSFSLKPEWSAQPDRVMLDVQVEKFTEKSLFVPVTLPQHSDSIKYFPTQVRIVFQIGLSRYSEVSSSDFSIEAEFDTAKTPTPGSLPLLLSRQPSFIRNVRIFPETVDYLIVEGVFKK